jgi:NAD(P)-dependent dehydrogenase (short-subunit alcohol dehydrogenase family)
MANLDRLYKVIKMQGRRIDVVFANAGSGEFAAWAASLRSTSKLFNVHVKGVRFTVQKAFSPSERWSLQSF